MLSSDEINIIINGCINQNRKYQQEFYKKFYGYAAAICMRYIHDREQLLEIVNDGFVKVFRELQIFRVPTQNVEQSLKAWIRKIMINTSIDHYRRNIKGEPSMVSVDEKMEDTLESSAITPLDKLTYDEVIQLVSQLSPMYRLIFNMYIIDGMTHDDIAKELNISVGTSKSNLSKAGVNMIKLIENKQKAVV